MALTENALDEKILSIRTTLQRLTSNYNRDLSPVQPYLQQDSNQHSPIEISKKERYPSLLKCSYSADDLNCQQLLQDTLLSPQFPQQHQGPTYFERLQNLQYTPQKQDIQVLQNQVKSNQKTILSLRNQLQVLQKKIRQKDKKIVDLTQKLSKAQQSGILHQRALRQIENNLQIYQSKSPIQSLKKSQKSLQYRVNQLQYQKSQLQDQNQKLLFKIRSIQKDFLFIQDQTLKIKNQTRILQETNRSLQEQIRSLIHDKEVMHELFKQQKQNASELKEKNLNLINKNLLNKVKRTRSESRQISKRSRSPSTRSNSRLTDRPPASPNKVLKQIMHLLKIHSQKQILPILKSLKNSQKITSQQKSFIRRVTSLIVDCSPPEAFQKAPHLKHIWKWLRRLVQEYLHIKNKLFQQSKSVQIVSKLSKALNCPKEQITKKLQIEFSQSQALLVILNKVKILLQLRPKASLAQLDQEISNKLKY